MVHAVGGVLADTTAGALVRGVGQVLAGPSSCWWGRRGKGGRNPMLAVMQLRQHFCVCSATPAPVPLVRNAACSHHKQESQQQQQPSQIQSQWRLGCRRLREEGVTGAEDGLPELGLNHGRVQELDLGAVAVHGCAGVQGRRAQILRHQPSTATNNTFAVNQVGCVHARA